MIHERANRVRMNLEEAKVSKTYVCLMSSLVVAAMSGCQRPAPAVPRMLLPGQQLIQIPAPPGAGNRSASGQLSPVRFLFETAMYPGEKPKMDISVFCGLEKFSDAAMEQVLTQAGFDFQWALRFADEWPERGLRFRRGALYGDLYTQGDDAHQCRVFLVRVQLAVDPQSPLPWAEPFLSACDAFTPNAKFPFGPEVYPVSGRDPQKPACRNSDANPYYKFLVDLPLRDKPRLPGWHPNR